MADSPIKTCTKCGQQLPATQEFFYRNSGGKYGITPRCKPCVDEDNRISHQKRLERDPDLVRAQATARTKRHYQRNLEQSRERHRIAAAKARHDPKKLAKIQARKRAGGLGLTPEEIETIRIRQHNQCAICRDPDPSDLDHCHKTETVRFLLCRHCNRGLGAFRDRPDLLRQAAALLESFYDHQPG